METDKLKMSEALQGYLDKPLETRFVDPDETLPEELPPLKYADDDAVLTKVLYACGAWTPMSSSWIH